MRSNRQVARTAGLLYLIVVVTGIFSLIYVPSRINVPGDASATVRHIVESGLLFRLGIVAGIACYTAFLLLPLVLYKLLAPVGRSVAATMVALATVSVPISFVAILHKLDVLTLLGGAGYLTALTEEQLHATVMLSLAAYSNGILVASLFWGLWLLPFGYLVYASRLLPRVLGVLLMLGCLGDVSNVIGQVLFPAYWTDTLANLAALPGSFGEIGTCLWLLVMGAREYPAHASGWGGDRQDRVQQLQVPNHG